QLANQQGRKIWLIAESDLNDARFLITREQRGYGMDAQWNDDFHHAVHTLMTGEQTGYYRDFGRVQQLAKACTQGYVYDGEFSEYRERRHGNSPAGLDAKQFVVF